MLHNLIRKELLLSSLIGEVQAIKTERNKLLVRELKLEREIGELEDDINLIKAKDWFYDLSESERREALVKLKLKSHNQGDF